MTQPSPAPSPRRPWVPWAVAGGAVAVAVVAAVVVVPLLAPASAPSPTPTQTDAVGPSPSATSTPTPTPTATCTVTTPSVAWFDVRELALPADGEFTADRVQRIRGADEFDFLDSTGFLIDDDRFGIITFHESSSVSVLTVAERDGEVLWTREIEGSLAPVSSPALTGAADRIVVSVAVDTDWVMRSLDLATGETLAERPFGEHFAVFAKASRASSAAVAPASADAFYVSDRETLSRVNADTLETEWSASGSDFGVDEFEGGVPFWVTEDVVFVGSHALDAQTGESLGWESAGAVFLAGGATLQTMVMYDHVGPYDLSGLDTATGETCWSREIISMAGTADTLWVLTTDGAVERIDPATGATEETLAQTSADTLHTAGRFLVAYDGDEEDYSAPVTATVFDGSTQVGELTLSSGAELYGSGDQLVVYERGTSTTPASLTAYDLPSTDRVWRAKLEDAYPDAAAGGLLQHRETSDGDVSIIDVYLLHGTGERAR
ncbi:PQQ-binding-like beta-propeller repeat protein [Microbacterium sp. PA5]|uniref:outer membrane protein assembly factor BamB family protein n=1 Tax=Microbacterium sp. PA5 TaxID=3416654 RepID=UPI003CFA76A8